jgi:biopolymer transport protein ExbD
MEENRFDYMNIIPLVDVMMVLLVIVLMTSTIKVGDNEIGWYGKHE